MAVLFTETQTALGSETVESASVKAIYETMYFLVNTTVATAGTLDIELRWSVDGATWVSFSTPDDFAQITATGETWLGPVPARAPFLQLNYVSVTGPFTLEVAAVGF